MTEAPEPPDRYRATFDVRVVPPQAEDVAKRCALRVQHDLYPPEGAVRREPSAVDQLRRADSRAFVERVFATLASAHPDARRIDDQAAAAEQWDATVAAMAAGAPLILAGRLPDDLVGRRRGRPDVLVRAGERADGRWAYHPLTVRHRRVLDPTTPPATDRPATVASLAAPAFADAVPDDGYRSRAARADLLALAHHHRLLEAAGHASAEPVGAIIGREERPLWVRLDEPTLRPRRNRDGAQETALERYDDEFAFRLDVLAAAAAGTPLVEPVWIGECSSCPWSAHCRPRLEAADSVSLLPGVSGERWRTLRELGITTRAGLAALDVDSAVALDAFGSPEERADAVLGARAIVHHGGRPVLRHGHDELVIPAADVEIDIDMENGIDGSAYLWGALVDGVYRAATSWQAAGPAVEAAVFVDFWEWLQARRAAAAREGRSLVTYCWYRGAESGALRNGAEAAAAHLGRAEAPAEVDDFLASTAFVDLWDVFTTQLVTGASHGLKTVAALAGFSWRDEDPDGALSMVWHAEATGAADPAVREAARARLLAYNEDDVRATAAVRRWLRDLPLAPVSPRSAP